MQLYSTTSVCVNIISYTLLYHAAQKIPQEHTHTRTQTHMEYSCRHMHTHVNKVWQLVCPLHAAIGAAAEGAFQVEALVLYALCKCYHFAPQDRHKPNGCREVDQHVYACEEEC